MTREGVVGIVIVAFLVWTTWAHPPRLVPDDATEIPKKVELHGVRQAQAADETLDLFDRETGESRGTLYRRSDVMWEPKSPINADRVKWTEHRYIFEFVTDAGPWAAAYLGSGNTSRFQRGLRVSPARIGFGVVSPDIVIGEEAAGVGVSLYPRTDLLSPFWHHVGVGGWYVVPYDRDVDPGVCVGLSLSLVPY
jgi:hypothetical protein